MKFLINICSHDGIVSHYTGVGTMTKRYIKALCLVLNNRNIEYYINLFTPQYNFTSFGYSKTTEEENLSLNNIKIIRISNGSSGDVNYGTPLHWKTLSYNTAQIINKINIEDYDKVFTIYNDTPFAGLAMYLDNEYKHKKIWIPHSTVKIHKVDSAIEGSEKLYYSRLDWEMKSIEYINKNENSFLGGIGNFICNHLIKEYLLNPKKIIRITNGELLDVSNITSVKNNKLFDEIDKLDVLMLSFARAEEYKNLEATMYLGEKMGISTVVIAQSYYSKQPILKRYKEVSEVTNTKLFIDPPFNFAKDILNNFSKKMILVVPSKKEIMGLVINEVRKLNKNNILIVANNIDGLNEQVSDGVDGLLVNVEELEVTANKIASFFNIEDMKKMNINSQKVLREKYDLKKNIDFFIEEILEV